MYLILIFIFGLAMGSFLNVIIFRLHEQKSFVTGRSFCLKCQKQIYWYDNIPLLSFVLLRGRCRHCQAKISWQYPAVELASGILFLTAYSVHVLAPVFNIITLARDLIFICILIIIFVYDLRWYLILDSVTVPAIILAFAVNFWLGFDGLNLLVAAGVGGGFFLAQYLVSRGHWIGGGDIRLGALMGVMLGWPHVLVALFIAYVSGAAVSIGLLVAGTKKLSSPVPFGTFLSAATVITLLWGEGILNWYLNII